MPERMDKMAIISKQPECARCDSSGWVCENHNDVAWGVDADDGRCAHGCGGAGSPCPMCNPWDQQNHPRDLAGSTLICGWVNGEFVHVN